MSRQMRRPRPTQKAIRIVQQRLGREVRALIVERLKRCRIDPTQLYHPFSARSMPWIEKFLTLVGNRML